MGGIGLLFAVAGPVHAYPLSDYTWQSYGGHQYSLTKDFGTWAQCQAEAQAVGGTLVSVNGDPENNWVAATFVNAYPRDHWGQAQYNLAWIGFHEASPGNWQWVGGDPVTIDRLLRHPLSDGPHAFIHLPGHPASPNWGAHNIYDNPSDPGFHLLGVIERVPEPCTLSLLAIGGLGVLRRRWRQ